MLPKIRYIFNLYISFRCKYFYIIYKTASNQKLQLIKSFRELLIIELIKFFSNIYSVILIHKFSHKVCKIQSITIIKIIKIINRGGKFLRQPHI